jgi:hypothetical protein
MCDSKFVVNIGTGSCACHDIRQAIDDDVGSGSQVGKLSVRLKRGPSLRGEPDGRGFDWRIQFIEAARIMSSTPRTGWKETLRDDGVESKVSMRCRFVQRGCRF